MFVQFIEGPVADRDGLRRQFDVWHEGLADGATGWLGTTAGVTSEDIGFVAARFESPESARANAERPEQSTWWAETERLFSGDVAFVDCEDVDVFRGGGSDDAGFVQVIRGKVNDVAAARSLFLEEMPDDVRPDVIGGLLGVQPDGSYTSVVYFTSEAEARAGETEDEAQGVAEEMFALHDTPPRFLDLTEPWLSSP